FLSFSVDLLSTTGDVTLSWTSPMYPKLYSNDTNINPLSQPITVQQDAWLGSLVTIGAMVGPFPFSFLAEKYGRKISLLCIALPHTIAYLTMAFARNIYWFYFGRVLGGLAMGGGYTLVPMYIAEVSRDKNRGAMSQTLNVFTSIGNFLPYAIGPFLSVRWFNLILAAIPTVCFLIFVFVGPETPHYL
ncbi:sugar transporter ERD6-like 4, partial [Anoplophora glabripennis]|uniref:sugar transporter ERD6-like 4 n=1 Tax=Anoplophora glabripennis TaxID=217634 RepID=UPI000C760D43